MNELARALMIIGLALFLSGLMLLALSKFPAAGRLPGDILIKKEHFTFYFPLATSLLLSLFLSVLLYFLNRR